MTSAWQHGRITNLEYVLYCNLAAGRSFNDLTQWPVFPWVLADYTSAQLDLDSVASFRDLSLPMGAVNAQRLEMLQQRFREMPREQARAPLLSSSISELQPLHLWMRRASRLCAAFYTVPFRLKTAVVCRAWTRHSCLGRITAVQGMSCSGWCALLQDIFSGAAAAHLLLCDTAMSCV